MFASAKCDIRKHLYDHSGVTPFAGAIHLLKLDTRLDRKLQWSQATGASDLPFAGLAGSLVMT